MANYTAHYHLHQWEPEDSFLRRDFNEDFQKIDAGLAGRGDCSLLFGSYVGTGTCGPSEPTVLTLGIPAKARCIGNDVNLITGIFFRNNVSFTYSSAVTLLKIRL